MDNLHKNTGPHSIFFIHLSLKFGSTKYSMPKTWITSNSSTKFNNLDKDDNNEMSVYVCTCICINMSICTFVYLFIPMCTYINATHKCMHIAVYKEHSPLCYHK